MAQHLTFSGEESSNTEAEPIGWLELELSHHNTLISGYRSLLTSLLLVVNSLRLSRLPDPAPFRATERAPNAEPESARRGLPVPAMARPAIERG